MQNIGTLTLGALAANVNFKVKRDRVEDEDRRGFLALEACQRQIPNHRHDSYCGVLVGLGSLCTQQDGLCPLTVDFR